MKELRISLTSSDLMLAGLVILIILIINFIVFIFKNIEYKRGAYYQITKNPYFLLKYNKGNYGEYLTYKNLKMFETVGAKFLFNIYIPKADGGTTEIDVLMICKKGIFVFESKNYNGWIFGSENQKNWYQTLPKGRGRSQKEVFYNPIMQNRLHVKHIKAFLAEQVPMWSIIVFSNNCTLKNVQIYSNDVSVLNFCDVMSVVSNIYNQFPDRLSDNDITKIYNELYPYTQVNDIVKLRHIANINHNLNHQHIQQFNVKSAQTITQNATIIAQPDSVVMDENNKSFNSKIGEQQILKCPKCNGDLVLRTANRGSNIGNQFYGCSNFPKCKYIQNIAKQKPMGK